MAQNQEEAEWLECCESEQGEQARIGPRGGQESGHQACAHGKERFEIYCKSISQGFKKRVSHGLIFSSKCGKWFS